MGYVPPVNGLVGGDLNNRVVEGGEVRLFEGLGHCYSLGGVNDQHPTEEVEGWGGWVGGWVGGWRKRGRFECGAVGCERVGVGVVGR